MIDRSHDLPVSRQAELVGISRGSVYYLPRPVPESDLVLMRRMDQLHLDYPFAGARMLQKMLTREGLTVGRRHVTTLMQRMGIEALYRRPNTSKPEPGHKIHPYLLRGLDICTPNQVWAMDITFAGKSILDRFLIRLTPDGERLCVSRRRDRLVHAARFIVAPVDQHGDGVLY